ncbi:MAG: hypothetical protein WAQ57_03295 [Candidatus Saccharimonadales bacterium]
MFWLFALVAAAVILFGFVVLFGAPYLPTLRLTQAEALELLALKPGQTLLELGSGDGRMLKAAAKKGIHATGYELNPLLVIYSRAATWRYRQLVTVKFANFWAVKLPPCDGIYVFLLDKYMPKLHNKVTREISNSIKLVSYAFQIPGKQAITDRNGLYLYKYTTPRKPSAS